MKGWPRLVSCEGCRAEVLLARGVRQGHPFRLEPREVFPEGTCTRCSGRGTCSVELAATGAGRGGGGAWRSVEPGDMAGRTRYAQGEVCPVCRGSGRRGELVPDVVVAVGPYGVARRLDDPGAREYGEALHAPHRCAAAAVAA